MRRAATLVVLTLAASPAVAADCSGEVQAAFEKQRLAPNYRTVSKQPSPNGEIEIQMDLVRPDKMQNSIKAPGEPAPIETIAIGRWAWGNHGGGWQELQPQFAQSVTFDVDNTLNKPAQTSEPFSCLGKVTRDGRDMLAYQTEPKVTPGQPAGPGNPPLARTIFVDPATGLPVLNIVAEGKPDATPLMSAAYSYPEGVIIEKPDAIPAGRTR